MAGVFEEEVFNRKCGVLEISRPHRIAHLLERSQAPISTAEATTHPRLNYIAPALPKEA